MNTIKLNVDFYSSCPGKSGFGSVVLNVPVFAKELEPVERRTLVLNYLCAKIGVRMWDRDESWSFSKMRIEESGQDTGEPIMIITCKVIK